MHGVIATSSVRQELRSATQPDHDRTEAAFDTLDIHHNPSDFALWLGSMQDMHCRFGPAVDRASQLIGLPLIQAELLELITQDFAQTGFPAPARHTIEQDIDNTNEIMGVTYAIEGSGMGARVLKARALKAGVIPSAYIAHLADMSAARWPVFMAALDHRITDPQAAIQGAKAVFNHLETTLKNPNYARHPTKPGRRSARKM